MTKAWCPILSKDLSEDELAEAYPGLASSACQDWNTLETMDGAQVIADANWQELINNNGQAVYYYVYGFDMNRAQDIFGEDVLAKYQDPFEIKVYVDIKDMPKDLGPYGGFFADDTITGYIHIKTFEKSTADLPIFETLGLRHEPKPQDIIQVINFGCDRPGDRSANYYEITNKEDQLISESMNVGYGHYVWRIKAKRYMFDYEGGAIEPKGEDGNEQVYDNNVSGYTTSTADPAKQESDKTYDFNVDDQSKRKIFNQSYKNQDDIYGGYYN
jgi:hypothetical protein